METALLRFVEALEKELTAEDIDIHLEGCIGCGNCGHACNWYLVTNDPSLHPKERSDIVRRIYRRYLTARGKIFGKLGLIKTLTLDDLEGLKERFWQCTMCGRCSLACMQGVSNRRLTQLGRIALTAADILPEPIKKVKENTRLYRHAAGGTFETTMKKIIDYSEAQGLKVPVDAEGADYLWVCSSVGNATEIIEKSPSVVKLFNYLGIKYTISSRIIDTGLEVQQTVGDRRIGRQMMEDLEAEAKRLKVKAIMIPECPCDIRTWFVEPQEWLGRPLDVEVDYIDLILLDYAREGKLPLEKLDLKVTYHDPCWTVRLTGYIEQMRELLKFCVEDFIEMTPNREYNYCCNGGVGTLRIYPREEIAVTNLRRRVSLLKFKQIEATGAEYVIVPCAACYLSIKDTLAHYNSDIKVETLVDIVARSMEKAVEVRGEKEKMRLPWNIKKEVK
jgi:Fe-S oxidoreductase